MSLRKARWALGFAAAVLMGAPALWAQADYLDVYIAKVKPEKAADAEAIAKKIADANRHNNGDHVIAMETLYGDNNTYVFVTRRQDYADVDKGNDAFMGAMNKAFGKQAAEKLLNDWNSCLISSRSELRLRRPDLSSKMPSDPESYNKMIGESRVLRTIAVHIRPGHVSDFEALVKNVNRHAEKHTDARPMTVSQVIEGGHGSTFYLTTFRTSMGGFDKNPTLKDILGEKDLAEFEKNIAESEAGAEFAIYRFRPELSYPPDEIAQVASDYWQPKPVVAAAHGKTKAGATEMTPAAAKSSNAKPQK